MASTYIFLSHSARQVKSKRLKKEKITSRLLRERYGRENAKNSEFLAPERATARPPSASLVAPRVTRRLCFAVSFLGCYFLVPLRVALFSRERVARFTGEIPIQV